MLISDASNVSTSDTHSSDESFALSQKRSGGFLLSGLCVPCNEKRTIHMFMKLLKLQKNTVEMSYAHMRNSISPSNILLDYPYGDVSVHQKTEWIDTLNCFVIIPKNSPLEYPTEYNKTIDHTVMVDLMKCTANKYKHFCFYFPAKFTSNKTGSMLLTSNLCNSACFSGYSAINYGPKNKVVNDQYDTNKSFRIVCHRYQLYKKATKSSILPCDGNINSQSCKTKSKHKTNGCKYVPQKHKRSALSKNWYKDGIRDSSAVNDRKKNHPNGKKILRRSNSQFASCKSQRCNFQLTI